MSGNLSFEIEGLLLPAMPDPSVSARMAVVQYSRVCVGFVCCQGCYEILNKLVICWGDLLICFADLLGRLSS